MTRGGASGNPGSIALAFLAERGAGGGGAREDLDLVGKRGCQWHDHRDHRLRRREGGEIL